MGGPRANFFAYQEGKLYWGTNKWYGDEMPLFMLMGVEKFTEFVLGLDAERIATDNAADTPYDELYTEGAMFADADAKVLLVGFDNWWSGMFNRDFWKDIPVIYGQFHLYEDSRQKFLNIIAPYWQGWDIRFCQMDSFGIDGSVYKLNDVVPCPLETLGNISDDPDEVIRCLKSMISTHLMHAGKIEARVRGMY